MNIDSQAITKNDLPAFSPLHTLYQDVAGTKRLLWGFFHTEQNWGYLVPKVGDEVSFLYPYPDLESALVAYNQDNT